MALERARQQVAVVGGIAQQIDTHMVRLERVAILVSRALAYALGNTPNCGDPPRVASPPARSPLDLIAVTGPVSIRLHHPRD
ncbi:hypothetical protein MBOU_04410 [Mycobacterium bourgelatii]|uniref:Uncharacterized protein n=1 Tax=Mycobacterium bourgelatii TaxID=1273442 RepID=A0A7I9YIG6_MYCBU|nr:hypothetical protein MBOU_04410 [Mycobacterium bourgelatii]